MAQLQVPIDNDLMAKAKTEAASRKLTLTAFIVALVKRATRKTATKQQPPRGQEG